MEVDDEVEVDRVVAVSVVDVRHEVVVTVVVVVVVVLLQLLVLFSVSVCLELCALSRSSVFGLRFS